MKLINSLLLAFMAILLTVTAVPAPQGDVAEAEPTISLANQQTTTYLANQQTTTYLATVTPVASSSAHPATTSHSSLPITPPDSGKCDIYACGWCHWYYNTKENKCMEGQKNVPCEPCDHYDYCAKC